MSLQGSDEQRPGMGRFALWPPLRLEALPHVLPGWVPTMTWPLEVRDKILERIANGESLRAICRSDDMPPAPTVCRWLAEDQSFREQYARAREAQADALFDDILEIADSPDEDPRRSKLRIDARIWAASKLKPKVYGDKLETTHQAGDTIKEIVRSIVRAA